MNEDRFIILKMVEEGKITAEEGVALLEALSGEVVEPKRDEVESERPASGDERSKGAKSHDFAAHIREAVQSALKSVPHVTEEVKENLNEVRQELQKSLKYVKEELKKGPLVDISGLSELFSNLRGAAKGSVHEMEETVTGSLSGGGASALLETRSGSVTVRGWDRSTYKVTMKMRAFADSAAEANELLDDAIAVTTDDDRLEVVAKEGGKLSVSLEAWLPNDLALTLAARSKNGGVSLEGARLESASLETVNGSVKVNDVAAEALTLKTVNGKLSANQATAGRVEARTTNGGIVWSGAAKEARIESVNGSIRATAGLAAAWGQEVQCEYVMKCVNGSIRAQLPDGPGVGARLNAAARRVELVDAEASQWEQSGGRQGKMEARTAETRGFSDAKRRLTLEATTVNGTVRVGVKGDDGDSASKAAEDDSGAARAE